MGILVEYWWTNDEQGLLLYRTPAWYELAEEVHSRFCPCCSWRSKIYESLPERLQDLWYDAYDKVFGYLDSLKVEIYRAPPLDLETFHVIFPYLKENHAD